MIQLVCRRIPFGVIETGNGVQIDQSKESPSRSSLTHSFPHHSLGSPCIIVALTATMRFVPRSANDLSVEPSQYGTPLLIPEVSAQSLVNGSLSPQSELVRS